jgi:uncharacterized membrane protein YoaK (UPF0700 family)
VPSRPPERQPGLRHALVVVLAANSGATDAIGFLALGGAFTSVMTGNLVLFGISVAHADGTLARHTAIAISCYIAGCVIGARLAGTAAEGDRIWPATITRALLVELAVFGIYAVGWWMMDARPHGGAQLLLLAANAIGLGIQSSAVQRFGIPGLSTTYMTGTLTTLIVRLTSGHRISDIADSGQLLMALIGGAALSGVLNRYTPQVVPALQLASISGVILTSSLLTPLRNAPANSLAP